MASNDRKTQLLRYERFAREYVLHHNATKAYKTAGYEGEGHVAESAASRLLRNVEVQKFVAQFERESHERLEITKDRIEREFARIAFADPRRFYGEDGAMLTPDQLGDNEAAALSSIEVFEEFAGTGAARIKIGETKKVRFWDKVAALNILGAPHGIGIKRIEMGKPGEFRDTDPEAVRKRILEKAARRGIVVKFPAKRGG